MTVEHLNSGEILSQATMYNGVVNVCGLTADDLSLNAKGQTEQILAKIDDRLASCGTDKSKLLMATIYLSNMDDKPGMNAAWTEWLGDLDRPARACVGSALGSPDTLVEIVVSAAK
jgi:enamine deaminase RidA (YjgF/YER057c/UK114 family)|tara:strand:+ start:295 stop:642 length:348 start_codon:yes stop_codon:yes gene_type:complete